MRLLDLTTPDLTRNLAIDEALLLERESRPQLGEILRFWEYPRHAVVLGSGGIIRDDVDIEACQRDGVPVARRSSGGGTVLLGPGCLLYSLVLDMEANPALSGISTSYEFIMGAMARAVAPNAAMEGSSDLAIDGLKFSGNAQQRKRRFLLHHGTMLVDFNLALVPRYLKAPPRQPEYRGGRGHQDFIRNLGGTMEELRQRIIRTWSATDPGEAPEPEAVERCLRERFHQPGWVSRR